MKKLLFTIFFLCFFAPVMASSFMDCKLEVRIIKLERDTDERGRYITFDVEEIAMDKDEQGRCAEFLGKEYSQFVTSKDKGALLLLDVDELVRVHYFEYGGMGPYGEVRRQIWNLK